MPCIVFFEGCRLAVQRKYREIYKRNKLESITFHVIINHYLFREELSRKGHITDNFNFTGAYNRAIDRGIVCISKGNVVINKDKQVAFVFTTTRVIGSSLVTTRKLFTFVLD